MESPAVLDHSELATVIVALSWWAGRKGRVPLYLQPVFDLMPPLTQEETAALIVRLSKTIPLDVATVPKLIPPVHDPTKDHFNA